MIKSEYKWESLWDLFEQVIAVAPNQQENLLDLLCADDISLKNELKKLLKAHYSQATILDQQPQWQDDFISHFQAPKQINGYTIEQKLGSGSLGEVYKASKHDDKFTRSVAIKFATAGRYSAAVLHSFKNELNILLSLNHPHIERLFEGGITAENIPYLIVEFIDGQHVDAYCDNNRLAVKQRLRLFQSVCDAVDTVHRSLIIHRDIKASNIMVDKQGVAKLLDFGIAKLTGNKTQPESTQTNLSNFMMTLAYASPEQINGTAMTVSSDIYSLGVLLYYLLTGHYPYQIDNNDLAVSIKTVTQVIPKLASQNINARSCIHQIEANLSRVLRGELEQILAKALAKEPARRYLSAAQFGQDMQNYLDNKPVTAKPDSLVYRIKKFILRHTLAVFLASTTAFFLLLLSVALFIQSQQLQHTIEDLQAEQKRVLQVTDFLIDIFNISDPLLTEKKIISVQDLLAYSSQQLQYQFNEEPATKATLYHTLGNVFMNLSLLKQSEIMLNQADMLYQQLGDKQGIINTTLSQSRLLQQQGLFLEADVMLQAIYQASLFSQLDITLQANIEMALGKNQYQLGKTNKARELLESALAKHIKTYGLEHQLVIDIYSQLGNIYWKLGDFKQVESYYQKSYAANLKNFGPQHHKSLGSLSSLGVLFYSQGDYQQAVELFNTVAQTRIEKLGENHVLSADALNRLGAVYYEMGDSTNAEINLQKALDSYRNIGLEKSIKYAKTLNNLGLVKRQKQQYQTAQELFLLAKVIEIELLGEKHSDVASLYNNLGMVAADLGHMQQALDLFKVAYAILVENQGLDNVNIAYCMTNIGRMYLQLNESANAQIWIDKALALRLEKLGENNLYYVETLSAAAELALHLNQREQAKTYLTQVLKVRNAQLPKSDWRIAEAENLLAFIDYTKDKKYHKMFHCSLIRLQQQFGQHHYRYQAAQMRQQQLKSHKEEISVCENRSLKKLTRSNSS